MFGIFLINKIHNLTKETYSDEVTFPACTSSNSNDANFAPLPHSAPLISSDKTREEVKRTVNRQVVQWWQNMQ